MLINEGRIPQTEVWHLTKRQMAYSYNLNSKLATRKDQNGYLQSQFLWEKK